jgi:Cadherin domain
MSSPAEQPSLILIRRLADGGVEWIPLRIPPQQVPATAEAAYTLIDRANYEAPQTLVVQRAGGDLVVQVQGTQVLVLEGFFTTANVAFYPTTSIASGAGPFSGAPLTPDSPVSAASTGEQVVWSAHTDDKTTADHDGGSSPMVWVGVAAGGVGLLALGASGGSGGGASGGGTSIQSAPDTVAPTITSTTTAPAIAENSGAGQVVYTTTATDAGTITYSLKAGGDAAAFSINANTGAVTLTANPDNEAKASYQFTVVATDAAHNSSERAVSLNIIDLDEVAPTITSGATASAINENSGSNLIVYTVTSTDTGDISSGNTTYSLKADGDADAFSINAATGAVRLVANPDFEAKSSYHFTVVATDAAGNSAERAVSLAIVNIVDLDEVAPTITSGATATAIDENSGSNQITGAVRLTANPDF